MFIETAAGIPEIVVFCLSALVILGHNLWLVAVEDRDEIKIEVVTSDKFPESDSAVKPERIKDFRIFTKDASIEITEYRQEGNFLVADLKKIETTKLVALELYPHPIVLEAEKFAAYIRSEAAETAVAPLFVAGETREAQRESYVKFAKVLIDDECLDRAIGHKLEIVFEVSRFEMKASGRLKVKVLFDGAPIENLRVSAGAENLNGGKYSAHARTNENGAAELEISGTGLWFVRTHYIRPNSGSDEYDWESFWSSTTFRI